MGSGSENGEERMDIKDSSKEKKMVGTSISLAAGFDKEGEINDN